MANKIINTRILSKIDTSSNWSSVDPVLLKGEKIVVDFGSGAHPRYREKIGDGVSKYSQLPFIDENGISVELEDDDVVILRHADGTTDSVKYDTNHVYVLGEHAKKGPTNGYETTNATSAIGPGESKIIKIPQLKVDEYGHTNWVEEDSVSITIPDPDGSGAILNNILEASDDVVIFKKYEYNDDESNAQHPWNNMVTSHQPYVRTNIDGFITFYPATYKAVITKMYGGAILGSDTVTITDTTDTLDCEYFTIFGNRVEFTLKDSIYEVVSDENYIITISVVENTRIKPQRLYGAIDSSEGFTYNEDGKLQLNKNYINSLIASGSVQYLGVTGNMPYNSTSVSKGDFYRVSSEFTNNSITAHVGDIIIANKDEPTSVLGTDWDVIHCHSDSDTNTMSEMSVSVSDSNATISLAESDQGQVVRTDKVNIVGSHGVSVSAPSNNTIHIKGNVIEAQTLFDIDNYSASTSHVLTETPTVGRSYNVLFEYDATFQKVINPGTEDERIETETITNTLYDTVVFSYAEVNGSTQNNPYVKSWNITERNDTDLNHSITLTINGFDGTESFTIDGTNITGFNRVTIFSPESSLTKEYSLVKDGTNISLVCSDGTIQTITDSVASPGEVNISAGKDSSGKDIEGSIIMNSGIITENAKYAIVGGTGDADLVEDLVGSIGVSVDVEAPKAEAPLSLSIGSSTVAKTAGSMAFGFDVVVGTKGFYWDHYKYNDGTFKGFTVSEDKTTATIALAKKQKRDTAYSSSSWATSNKNFLVTDADYASASSFPWKVNDYITIYNRDLSYPICGKIVSVGLKSQTRTGSGLLGGTYSTTNNVWCIDVKALDDLPFPFTTPTEITTTDSLVGMVPHYYAVSAYYDEAIEVLGVDTGKTKPVERTGLVDIGFGSFGAGSMNVAGGSFSQAFGSRNITTAGYSLVSGNTNAAGLLSLVSGTGNIAAGRQSFISGNSNKILNPANDSAAIGQGNKVYSEQSVAMGRSNTIDIYANESVIAGGSSNVVSKNSKNSFIGAGNSNIIGGTYDRTDSDGNIISSTFYSGNNNFVAGNNNATYSNDTAVVGEANVNLSANSFIAGRNNLLTTNAGETTILGSQNTVGNYDKGSYGNLVSGNANNLVGTYNAMFGNANTTATTANSSIISGTSNTVGSKDVNATIKNTIISGTANKVNQAENSIVTGNSNSVTSTAGEVAVFGQGNTVSTGGQSLVAGHTNTASHGETFVAGKFNKASHHAASVLGIQNISSKAYQTVVGVGAAENSNALFIVGNGSVAVDKKLADDYDPKNANRKNAFEVLTDGTAVATTLRSSDIGDGTYGLVNGVLKAETVITNGIYNEKFSLISGKSNTVNSKESAVFGSDNKLMAGEHNIVAGNGNTLTNGTDIGIFGQKITLVNGDQSFMTGLSHKMAGSESAIIGGNTNTIGIINADGTHTKYLNAFIGGGKNNTVKVGNSAILAGSGNTVSGETSAIAAGSNNTLTSADSFCAGDSNKNVAKSSGNYGNQITIFGFHNNASCSDSLTCGRWSAADDNALFAVGNGNNDTSRKTVFAIKDTGVVNSTYKIIVESSTTSSDSGKTLATKDYVDSKAGSGSGSVSINSFDTTYFKTNSSGKITLNLNALLDKEW